MPVKEIWELEEPVESDCWRIIKKILSVREYTGFGFFNEHMTKIEEEREPWNHKGLKRPINYNTAMCALCDSSKPNC